MRVPMDERTIEPGWHETFALLDSAMTDPSYAELLSEATEDEVRAAMRKAGARPRLSSRPTTHVKGGKRCSS